MIEQKMTKETLEKAMRSFLKDYYKDLWQAYEEPEEENDEYIEVSDEEAFERALSELTSDSVLNYINENLTLQPVIEFKLLQKNIINEVLEAEEIIGHGVHYIDALFNVPVCKLGERDEEMACAGALNIYVYDCLFLTMDGEWKFAKYLEINEENSETSERYYVLRQYKKTKQKCYSLDNLEKFLSEGLNEVINVW